MKGRTEHLISFVGAILERETVDRLLSENDVDHIADIDLNPMMSGSFRYEPDGPSSYWVGIYTPNIITEPSLNILPHLFHNVRTFFKGKKITEPIRIYNLLVYY
jgi:hypothetical protein